MLNISKIQFKSNSQQIEQRLTEAVCCAQYLKDTIQKQFTTVFGAVLFSCWLCSISQRYNSKAIHNALMVSVLILTVVLNISKIQFKSNSQLKGRNIAVGKCCAQYLKDTIQKQFTTILIAQQLFEKLCSISQRYNSKAIHNISCSDAFSRLVVLNISKIQFKSNSQPW